MRMGTRIVLAGSAIFALGLAATLLSGFYARNMTEFLGMSRIGYGFPLAWHGYSQMVVYPMPPAFYWCDEKAFALDLTFWSLAFALLSATIFVAQKVARRT